MLNSPSLNPHGEELVKMLNEGYTYQQIGERFGVSNVLVAKWLKSRGHTKPAAKNISNKLRNDAESISKRYLGGESTASIAESYNCSDASVLKVLKENEVKIRGSKPNVGKISAQKDKILSMYKQGETTVRIARELECDPEAIRYNLKKWGVNTSGENQIKIPARKHKLYEDYFSIVDSWDKAYWIGWLLSDGCVNNKYKISLNIHNKDIDVLKKFARSVNHKGNIYSYKNRDSSTLQLHSKKMVDDLKQWNVIQCKTHNLKFPSNISQEFIPALINGFLMGDGYISQNSIGICCCNKDFLLDLRNHLPSEIQAATHVYERSEVTSGKTYSDCRMYDLVIYQKRVRIAFLKWIYQDATIFMDRKRKLAKDIYGV